MTGIEERVAEVRAALNEQGIDALLDFAEEEEYRLACVRLFLQNRPRWLDDILSWAREVERNCDFFLPAAISSRREPVTYGLIVEFEEALSDEIQKELKQNPGSFQHPSEFSSVVKLGISAWKADKSNKSRLKTYSNYEEFIARDEFLVLLKQAYAQHGIKTSKINECDLITEARIVLANNPKVYALLNETLSRRRSMPFSYDIPISDIKKITK